MGNRQASAGSRKRRREPPRAARGIAPQDWEEAIQPFVEELEERYERTQRPFCGSFWMCACQTVVLVEGPREFRAVCDSCGGRFIPVGIAKDQPDVNREHPPSTGS